MKRRIIYSFFFSFLTISVSSGQSPVQERRLGTVDH